jgi:hypothetical protein
MSDNTGKTVDEILVEKRAEILRAPLDRGSPSWDDIRGLTWEEVDEMAKKRRPGFRTIRKLLSNRRYDK